jgi:hypothetical protein
MFVPVTPFQPSVMIVGKARAYLSKAPFRYSTRSNPQALDKVGKTGHGQIIHLITEIRKLL